MAIPEFILALRAKVGTAPLWLIGATAVVIREQQVLLGKRADNGLWAPICGIVDPGEHPAAAAVREVAEETGVSCRVQRLAQVSVTDLVTYPNGDQTQYLDLTFRCDYLSGQAHVADDESIEVRWFDQADIPPLRADFAARLAAAMSEDSQARLLPHEGASQV